MDSERIAELKHDKEEIPESILERAREELRERALDGLTFETVLEALAGINDIEKEIFTKSTKFRKPASDEIMAFIVHVSVDRHLEPSQESVQQRAEEILADLDDRKGEDI